MCPKEFSEPLNNERTQSSIKIVMNVVTSLLFSTSKSSISLQEREEKSEITIYDVIFREKNFSKLPPLNK